MLLCKYEEKNEDKRVYQKIKIMVSIHLVNISNDYIDCMNNNFVLHMYLYIFV